MGYAYRYETCGEISYYRFFNWVDNIIDAAYEMLCWCVEKGYIKTKRINDMDKDKFAKEYRSLSKKREKIESDIRILKSNYVQKNAILKVNNRVVYDGKESVISNIEVDAVGNIMYFLRAVKIDGRLSKVERQLKDLTKYTLIE